MQHRKVVYVSDGTGITAEALGYSLLSQFNQLKVDATTISYVNSKIAATNAVERINQFAKQANQQPIVITTLVDEDIRQLIETSDGICIDLFKEYIPILEQRLAMKSTPLMGRLHSINDLDKYDERIEAVNFSQACDDGVGVSHYHKADVIVLGVSRCGKTPTSLYLALQFGVLAANYPFTFDSIEHIKLPELLKPHKNKLFGLTIEPERLAAIRSERRPNSQYASLKTCRNELAEVEALFRRERIPFMNATSYSVEEIATRIMSERGLERRA